MHHQFRRSHYHLCCVLSILLTYTSSTCNVLTTPFVTNRIGKQTAIPIGTSLPLNGETALFGTQLADGLGLFVNKTKQEEKNSSFFLQLSILDDQADFNKLQENVKKLSKTSPLFTSLFSTELSDALAPFLDKQKMALFFPVDGHISFRTPSYQNVIFFRPSFKKEIEALIQYTIEKRNRKNIAIFYEPTPWGKEMLSFAKNALQSYGVKPVAIAHQTANLEQTVNAIFKISPNAILCLAQSRPTYYFIRKMLNMGLYYAIFLGPSTIFPIQKTLQQSRGISIIVASVVPNPAKSKLPIAKEYRAAMKKYLPNKKLSPISFESYINATLLYESIKQVLNDPTKTLCPLEMIHEIEFLQEFKGLHFATNTQTRTLSNNIWINKGKKKKDWELVKIGQKND